MSGGRGRGHGRLQIMESADRIKFRHLYLHIHRPTWLREGLELVSTSLGAAKVEAIAPGLVIEILKVTN